MRSRKAGLAAAILALATITGTLTAPGPALAAEPDPVIGKAVFNNPAGTKAQQNTVYQQVARLIDRVPANAELRLSMFHFEPPVTADTAEDPDITARLLRAYERNVSVKIVLDQASNGFTATARLRQALGTDDTKASFVVSCDDVYKVTRGCIGTRTYTWADGSKSTSYNHNKFMAISKLTLNDGSAVNNVVYQASANMTLWDANEGYNNALTVADTTLYNAYLKYHKDLVSLRKTAAGNSNYYTDSGSGTDYRAFFFPRREGSGEAYTGSATDTIYNTLNSVKCSYKDEAGVTRQTDVRVMQLAFNRTPIATKLAELKKAGCWVDVVATDYSWNVLKELEKQKVQATRCNWNHAPGIDVRVHHKYMLIDGGYDDDIIPRTYTGSHNFAWSALRLADEALIRVMGRATHDDYMRNFWSIRDTCRPKPNGEIKYPLPAEPPAAASGVEAQAEGIEQLQP
ncbi:phospholipase D-like domain-containing protein [Actinoplanes sp. GCM10030250]|uniref:phospholipase D-like domain-containing protein n=1 Tax=Actinoplanes sp. GCM10030250 TaxID=3273376 RepID=UPI003619540D